MFLAVAALFFVVALLGRDDQCRALWQFDCTGAVQVACGPDLVFLPGWHGFVLGIRQECLAVRAVDIECGGILGGIGSVIDTA